MLVASESVRHQIKMHQTRSDVTRDVIANIDPQIARDTKRAEPGQLQKKVTKIGKLTSFKNALKPRLQNLIKQKVGVKNYETEDVDVKDQTKKSNCAADICCAG